MKYHLFFIAAFIISVFISCNEESLVTDDFQQPPVLITVGGTNITQTSFVCTAIISDHGGEPITERGFCWQKGGTPTIETNRTVINTKSDTFSIELTGLSKYTSYYIFAYAKNALGTGYGNTIGQKTKSTTFYPRFGPTVTDIDGNVYRTDTIGNQIWMVENLRTTRYRNGDSVINGTNRMDLRSEGAFCNYIDANLQRVYGRLYNFHAVNDKRGLAPVGWHVATIYDLDTLSALLEGSDLVGGKLKEAGTEHWQNPNTGATNETGFTALPGGTANSLGIVSNIGFSGHWWTSTESTNYGYQYYMHNSSSYVGSSILVKGIFLTVRCVKDRN